MYYEMVDGKMKSITSIRLDEAAKRKRDSGMSFMAQANEIGIDVTQLNKYRAGKSLPGVDILREFAIYYGVSADWLLGMDRRPR